MKVGIFQTPLIRPELSARESFGGFGTLLVFGQEYADNPEVWNRSLDLLTNEVAPNVGLG